MFQILFSVWSDSYFSVTEQEHLYEKQNPTKYEQIQLQISEAGSKVKDEQNASLKKIGIG